MKRVVITVSSPVEENCHSLERIRVRTPERFSTMKELSNGSGELKITEDEQRRAVSPTKVEYQSSKIQTTVSGDLTTEQAHNQLNDIKSAQEKVIIQHDNILHTLCINCGAVVELSEIESKFDGSRKELEAKKVEVEEIKTNLEYELFDRLRIEDEFTCERELLEREVTSLRERIEELEGEATWRIEDLENDFKVLTSKYENAKDEIAHLKVMLERTVTENVKLRNNQSLTDDRVMEILDEVEMWKRKAQENAERGDTSRSNLEAEIEMHEQEIQELRETLMEASYSNEVRERRLSELESTSCDCPRENSEDLDHSADVGDFMTNTIRTEITNSSREKHLLELSNELNDLYRDHVSCQEKFYSLHEGFVAKEQELEDVRGEYESQNIEIQNYKEKYAELKDVILATCQDNSHLKNRLEQKTKDYTELKKRFLVSETEVTWLRDALGVLKIHTDNV
ncbi:hypothetical protein QZH41_007991 [Actinostola sp. cb2023]|nr:hypothetical protein QZH41_007991 [Actinostola sp. cb2023]